MNKVKTNKLYKAIKKRFEENFIALSDKNEPGTNLAAGIKSIWGRDNRSLYWGDSTIMHSYYLMMLASEFHLTKTKKTLKKLKNALDALDRLDARAEMLYDNELGENISGFFIRDDIHKDLLDKFPYLKKNGIKSLYGDSKPFPFPGKGVSMFGAEMSQDQFWHLIMGLTFVIRVVDDKGCIEQAQAFTSRVMKHIDDGKWQIYNPVTGKKVSRGSNVIGQSFGFKKASEAITGKTKYKHYPFYGRLIFFVGRFGQRLMEKMNLNEKNYPYLALSTTADLGINKNLDFISWHTDNFGYYEHFPLIYNILHGKGDMSRYKKRIEDLLEVMPDNPDNYHMSDGKWESYEWSSPSRLIDPQLRGTANPHFNGTYNGLDFLLLYNLYKMVYKEK